MQSPQNPFLGTGTPNLARSKGLEGALTTDPNQRRLIINEFDVRSRFYTGRQWFYRLESTAHAIGDLTAIDSHRFLVIERDNGEGPTAAFKRIFLVDFRAVGADGFLIKRESRRSAEYRRSGQSRRLRACSAFPFQTIESVMPLDNWHLAVLNDNNYPFSAGRAAGSPDPMSSSSSGSMLRSRRRTCDRPSLVELDVSG